MLIKVGLGDNLHTAITSSSMDQRISLLVGQHWCGGRQTRQCLNNVDHVLLCHLVPSCHSDLQERKACYRLCFRTVEWHNFYQNQFLVICCKMPQRLLGIFFGIVNHANFPLTSVPYIVEPRLCGNLTFQTEFVGNRFCYKIFTVMYPIVRLSGQALERQR